MPHLPTSKVSVENVVCNNDHGTSGQVMNFTGNHYVCPECGRTATVEISVL